MTTLEAPAPKVELKPAPQPKAPSITRHVTDEHIFLIRKNMNGFAIPRQVFVDETQRRDSSA